MSGLLAELKARGFIEAQTDEKFDEILEKKKFTLYCGFDPTADSLHIGSLLPIMALRHFQKAGHKPIIVMGGGTGMVGDPSGKSSERKLLDNEALANNIAGMHGQFANLLEFDDNMPNGAKLVNNADWLNNWRLIDFLRDVGKHFPLSVMLSKDSVKSRLEGESGISFTEFSYQI
ncbi:MAG: tyrosine--tRNA ligase, partial [Candidatus Heimdallarchaeota archaeon]|nr:tyrosine--tRNA ligase [Candidatus Heimdallarchaeota archaeon]